MNNTKENNKPDINGSGKEAEDLYSSDREEKNGNKSQKASVRKIAGPALMLAAAMIVLVIISYTGLRLLLPGRYNTGPANPKDEQQDTTEKMPEAITTAEKIAFFTGTLNLSSDKAEQFWPLYNEFARKMARIEEERSDIMERVAQYSANMSGAQPEKWGDRLISLETEEAELKEEYHSKYKQILPASKLILIYYAEDSFKSYSRKHLEKIINQ